LLHRCEGALKKSLIQSYNSEEDRSEEAMGKFVLQSTGLQSEQKAFFLVRSSENVATVSIKTGKL
jgi:hypothetical protein